MNDNFLIKKTFILAKKGLWKTSPNPLVWAIIVKNNKIIWEWFHKKYWENHAEVEAINNAKESVIWWTLYCNLEPCCHTKKQTPPCTDLIIKSKIKKVVIANIDPNPQVSWKWIKKLKENWIEVIFWIEKEKWEILNEIFFTQIRKKRPFIHLKFAQTLDWKIATLSGNSKWISDESARKKVHKMRLKYDAILIWWKTLNNDNPSLTVRIWKTEKSKYRIIFWNPENMNLKSKIFFDKFAQKTIILASKKLSKKTDLFFKNQKIKVINCNSLKDWIDKLYYLKISSIFVEWWWKIINYFLEEKLFDKISIFIAPIILWKWIWYSENIENNFIKDAIKFDKLKITTLNNQVIYDICNF